MFYLNITSYKKSIRKSKLFIKSVSGWDKERIFTLYLHIHGCIAFSMMLVDVRGRGAGSEDFQGIPNLPIRKTNCLLLVT